MSTTTPDSIRQPAPTSTSSSQVLAVRHSHAVSTAAEFTTAGDKIALGVLPAGHVLVDCIFEGGDLDAGVGAVITVGIEGDTDALIKSNTVCQAGGIARMDNVDAPKLAATDADRTIYLYAGTPPATDANDTCALTLMYKAKPKA